MDALGRNSKFTSPGAIEALADTGCVAIAARMVNMSQPSFYQLRRQRVCTWRRYRR